MSDRNTKSLNTEVYVDKIENFLELLLFSYFSLLDSDLTIKNGVITRIIE